MNILLQQACRCLRSGGIVAYPTEAIYGLGCDPNNRLAIQKLRWLKNRKCNKGFILLAGQRSFLTPFFETDPTTEQLLQTSWPGPITWVVPARPSVSPLLSGTTNTIALRVTHHPLAAKVSIAFNGAIVSTSANPVGRSPARTALAVRRYFGDQVDFILGGPTGGQKRPSEIRELTSGKILRPS